MSGPFAFWRALAGHLEHGERVFLALVVENTRHSPGTAGARLLLAESGQRAGTIGGGIMEHKLLERAREILRAEDFAPEIQTLHHRRSAAGERSGMICAGSQTNLYALCRPESDLVTVRHAAVLAEDGRSGTLSIGPRGMSVEETPEDLTQPQVTLEVHDDGGWCYVEQLLNRRRLALLGGGHCAAALTHAMSRLGYDVFVFETREGVIGTELEGDARSIGIVGDFREASSRIDYPELTWVVVMTTDFPSDVRALSGVLRRPFPFVGVMGAPAKLEQIKMRLEEQGFSSEELERVQGPVGLSIPSHTPEEIAVSVAAQILKLR